ncbi:MAG: transcriptional regulator [Thermoproteus sp.]
MTEFLTDRERIIRVLLSSKEPLDVYQIRELAGLDLQPSEIYEELEHVARTLKRQSYKLMVVPARCRNCGYEFRDRERLKKPSKCPVCHSERIEPPKFYIRR